MGIEKLYTEQEVIEINDKLNQYNKKQYKIVKNITKIMKRLINVLPELFLFFGICVFVVSCDQKLSELQTASFEPSLSFVEEVVKIKHIENTGISIITYDNHEYLSYRNGSNAASVGGIVHSESCKCKKSE